MWGRTHWGRVIWESGRIFDILRIFLNMRSVVTNMLLAEIIVVLCVLATIGLFVVAMIIEWKQTTGIDEDPRRPTEIGMFGKVVTVPKEVLFAVQCATLFVTLAGSVAYLVGAYKNKTIITHISRVVVVLGSALQLIVGAIAFPSVTAAEGKTLFKLIYIAFMMTPALTILSVAAAGALNNPKEIIKRGMGWNESLVSVFGTGEGVGADGDDSVQGVQVLQTGMI